MANKNKVKFGLSNVHIFPVKEETQKSVTYDEVISIPGAVNLSLDVEGEEGKFYADDIVYFSQFANNGYSGDLEMALIPDEFKVKILGFEEDKNCAIFENVNARPKNFALAFEFKGDKNKTRRLYYNVSASRPSESHATVEDTIEPETETITITCIPRADTGDITVKLDEGQEGYNTFYTTVYEKVPKEEAIGA